MHGKGREGIDNCNKINSLPSQPVINAPYLNSSQFLVQKHQSIRGDSFSKRTRETGPSFVSSGLPSLATAIGWLLPPHLTWEPFFFSFLFFFFFFSFLFFFFFLLLCGSQSVVPGPAASAAAPASLLEMQILRPYPRPTDLETRHGTQQAAF